MIMKNNVVYIHSFPNHTGLSVTFLGYGPLDLWIGKINKILKYKVEKISHLSEMVKEEEKTPDIMSCRQDRIQ